MKFLRIFVLGLMFITFYICQKRTYGSIKEDDNRRSYADFIDKVQAYQNAVKLAREVKEPDKWYHWSVYKVDTSTFDVRHYLSFFDQCKPKAGYMFYLYSAYGRDSGQPVLFAKADTFDEQAYIKKMVIRNTQIWDSIIARNLGKYKLEGLSEEEINKRIKIRQDMKNGDTTKVSIMGVYALDSLHRSFRYLTPLDSEMGYLQYLFLYAFGEQFALYWHSNYAYKKIISDKKSVEYYLNFYRGDSSYSCDKEKLANLMNIDVSPNVTLNSEDCFITWFEIETHNGLFKRSYSIQRHPPYLIKKISSEKVVAIRANFFY